MRLQMHEDSWGWFTRVSMMIMFKRSHEVTDARGCMRMVKKISMIIMYQRFHEVTDARGFMRMVHKSFHDDYVQEVPWGYRCTRMHEDGEKDFHDNNVPEVPYDWLNRFCGKVEFFHNECMYNCTLYIVHILYIKIQDVKCVRRPLFGVLSYKFSRSCSFTVICMLCSARMLTLKYAAVQQSRPSLHNSCGVVVGCSWL